jgi:hypothetical protein
MLAFAHDRARLVVLITWVNVVVLLPIMLCQCVRLQCCAWCCWQSLRDMNINVPFSINTGSCCVLLLQIHSSMCRGGCVPKFLKATHTTSCRCVCVCVCSCPYSIVKSLTPAQQITPVHTHANGALAHIFKLQMLPHLSPQIAHANDNIPAETAG